MATYINIHTLHPFSYANPNRDDTGAAKETLQGGVRRARISSQSWKRAIRVELEQQLDDHTYRARPTTLAPLIAERVVTIDDSIDRDTAAAIAWVAVAGFTQKTASPDAARKAFANENRDKSSAAETLTWFSNDEVDTIAEIIAANYAELEPLTAKKAKASGLNDTLFGSGATAGLLAPVVNSGGPHHVMVAAFGRMCAQQTASRVDGAIQVAHAFTTHQMVDELDWFAAVDDLAAQGSGHLGHNQFTGGVYYRFMAINVDELAANMGNLPTETLEKLIAAMITTIPSGKRSTTANNEVPLCVLVEIGPRATSYASAFETAIDANIAATSVTTLFDYAERARRMELHPAEVRLAVTVDDVDLADDIENPGGLAALIERAVKTCA